MSMTNRPTQLPLGWFDAAGRAAAEEARRVSRTRKKPRTADSNGTRPVADAEGERMLLTVPEVARTLKIGRRQVWEMVWQGKLPVVRLGPRTVRVSRAELERYVLERSRPYGA